MSRHNVPIPAPGIIIVTALMRSSPVDFTVTNVAKFLPLSEVKIRLIFDVFSSGSEHSALSAPAPLTA